MIVQRVYRAFNSWIDRLFPKHHLVLTPTMRDVLAAAPLTVMDIGGAMGADERWNLLRDQCRFMFFEPDDRSQDGLVTGAGRDVVVPVGLGGADGERTLYLTEGPFASSLYRPNEVVLKPFAVWPWYRPAGQASVPVKTLDGVLAERSGWTPDFIKVDVEGADLEVLQAGEGALYASFGVQIEVSFLDRNEGAPGYGVADQWLRARGFVPHLLIREHWVRENALWGANSQAQIAWGDAVYFRPQAWALGRLADNPGQASRDLCAFVAILLAYASHDAALDLVRAARAARLASTEVADDLEQAIHKSVVSPLPYLLRGFAALLLALLLALLSWPLGGARRQAGRAFLARQAVPFLGAAYRLVARQGLRHSCLADR
jgi:FkbM family methyltransferase